MAKSTKNTNTEVQEVQGEEVMATPETQEVQEVHEAETVTETVAVAEVQEAPEQHEETAEAAEEAPKSTSSTLLGLLATVSAEKQQVQEQQTQPRVTRSSVTVHKINSASARDAQGNSVQRRNTTIGDRQVVAIISESAKLAHITTDINYAILTQAAAVNKANKELIKQQEIKIICNNPDLKVLVTQQRWSTDTQPGDSVPMQQRAKAEVYNYFFQKGFTMLGRIRRNVPSAGSLPVGEISFVEVGAQDVKAAPVVLGSTDISSTLEAFSASAAARQAAEAQAKAQAKAQKDATKATQAPQAEPTGDNAVDLKSMLEGVEVQDTASEEAQPE